MKVLSKLVNLIWFCLRSELLLFVIVMHDPAKTSNIHHGDVFWACYGMSNRSQPGSRINSCNKLSILMILHTYFMERAILINCREYNRQLNIDGL